MKSERAICFDSIDQNLLLSMAFLPFYRLMECAKGIEGGNLDIADSLLVEIRSLAPKKKAYQRGKLSNTVLRLLPGLRVC